MKSKNKRHNLYWYWISELNPFLDSRFTIKVNDITINIYWTDYFGVMFLIYAKTFPKKHNSEAFEGCNLEKMAEIKKQQNY